MGSEIIPLILIPVTAGILLIVAFGTPDTSPVLGDISTISNLITATSSRQQCINIYSQCDNNGCNNILNFPCGDLFYILLIIATVIGVPFLAIVLPALLMVPLTSINFAGQTYGFIDFWFAFTPMWAMFGLGASRMIW